MHRLARALSALVSCREAASFACEPLAPSGVTVSAETCAARLCVYVCSRHTMTAHEFTIAAGDLDAGGRHYLFAVRAPWMRAALEEHEATAGGADGKLDVRASKSGTDVVGRGTLQAALSVPCARCLEPVVVEID